MTTIARPVVRETAIEERGRPIIVELSPRIITLRLKGTREQFRVPFDVVLDLARKRDWLQKRA